MINAMDTASTEPDDFVRIPHTPSIAQYPSRPERPFGTSQLRPQKSSEQPVDGQELRGYIAILPHPTARPSQLGRLASSIDNSRKGGLLLPVVISGPVLARPLLSCGRGALIGWLISL
jgi:hypothetical protein